MEFFRWNLSKDPYTKTTTGCKMDEEDSDDRFQQLARVKVLSFVKNNYLGQCVLYFLVFL